MGNGWQRRKNAADSDVRRMYLRGRKGTLNVDALPLEQALALMQAKAGPKSRPARAKPLGSYRGIVAVTASEVAHSASGSKRSKLPWAAGRSQSGGVLRRKAQLRRSQPAPTERVPAPQNSSAKKAVPANQSRQKKPTPKQKKPKREPSARKYDGQPRFEGGFRFVQGGLVELGKR